MSCHGPARCPRRLFAALALAALAWSPQAAEFTERRDIVLACPCSAEWVADGGGTGTLSLHAGVLNHRATPSGQVRLSVTTRDGGDGAFWDRLQPHQRLRGDWEFGFDAPGAGLIELDLEEQTGRHPDGTRMWHRHETLALWPVPGVDPANLAFVDILTDSDGDGVGDVNERIAGSSPTDPQSTPGATVVDVLALYTAKFAEAEAGYPYTRLLHAVTVAGTLFEDSATNIRLRMVGMSAVELDDRRWAQREVRQELMDSHGADVTVRFGPDGPCGSYGCGTVGASRSDRWSGGRAWVGDASPLTTAHELGHVMGLTHSARQGDVDGAWRWSRGHYVTPRGADRRAGTIMAYGHYLLGGVFSDPTTDCGDGPCGVDAGEIDGADSVTTLDRLRFQVGAHREPAHDSDGDGFVDAADAVPDDPGDWFDLDGDGVGDNADPDDDNDGVADVDDAFPLDGTEWADADRDGVGDNADDDVRDLSPFRDPALRTAVEAALGKEPGAMIGAQELAALTKLDAPFAGIRDLAGLELATGLRSLTLRFNRVSDLTPLARLTNLQNLRLEHNDVIGLSPLSGLTALSNLALDYNEIIDLSPLSNLAMLTRLGLEANGVSDLSPLSNLQLRSLRLSGNPVEDISVLTRMAGLENLELNDTRVPVGDVAALPYLGRIWGLALGGLGVKDLRWLAAATRLEWLDLHDNAVSELRPLAGLTELRHLHLSNNRIADIGALAGLEDLASLELQYNRVADIGPLAGVVELTSLRLGHNRIRDVSPLAAMTRLRWLDVNDNAVSDIAPLVDRSIFGGEDAPGAYVQLGNNPLDEASVRDHIPTLESWGVRVNFSGYRAAVAFADPTLRALVAEALADAQFHVDDHIAGPIDRLRQLRIHGHRIASLAGLEALTNLASLYAAANRIADLSPLAALAALGELDLRDNRISDISPLVENAALAAGDWVALDGNPLSEASLNEHVPALIGRGVAVSVGAVVLSLVADGEPVRFDVSGYFAAVLGGDSTMTAATDDLSFAAAAMDDGALVVTPGARAGTGTATVQATDAGGRTETLTFELHVRGPWLVPLFPSAAGKREGFVRIVNRDRRDGVVRILPVDDTGRPGGRLALAIGAGAAVHFNSGDLEAGNPRKGLTGSSGPGSGDWRLELESDLDLEVLAYVRTADGFLTSMHDVARRTEAGYQVPTFNPASNVNQVSVLRLTNPGAAAAAATITGTDDAGVTPDAVRVSVGAGATLVLTAAELEGGAPGLAGAFGDGAGKWRLAVSADADLVVMSLLESPNGYLANLSTGAPAALRGDGVHAVALFPPAGDALGRQGFVRIVNRSGSAGQVRIDAYDDAGLRYGPLTLAIAGRRTAHFNSDDLEFGNAAKGISGSTGPVTGDWRLELSSELDIEVLAYVRTPGGFLTSMHDVVRTTGRRFGVATFNPASNANQASRLRIVNPGAVAAHVAVGGVDDAGQSPGQIVQLTIPGGASAVVTSPQLEGGDHRFYRRAEIGDGTGKWRLQVDSEQHLFVMNLLASPTGHLTNLSTSPNR